MAEQNTINVIRIIERTLEYVEPKLINHGERVSYIVYKMLKYKNIYSETTIRDFSLLALFHDIGAYKTEEISDMVNFETNKIWEHSIYGYLFIKYFSPLADLAPSILYHHADLKSLGRLEQLHQPLAQMIFIADRIDILSQSGADKDINRTFLENNKNILFMPDIVELLLNCGVNFKTYAEDLKTDTGFINTLYNNKFSEKEINSYINMIVLSIDFRSSQTVTHTFDVAEISRILAQKMNMPKEKIDKIYYGAMLHDLGKIGTPVNILESTSKLTPEEMEIMRQHVVITDKILNGIIDDETRLIAVRHHEKLNGRGYPDKLTGDLLTVSERLMAVADIFSALCGVRSYKEAFSKEKIAGIISDMSENNLIDPKISRIALDNYETIIERVEKISAPLVKMYDKIKAEYEELIKIINADSNISSY